MPSRDKVFIFAALCAWLAFGAPPAPTQSRFPPALGPSVLRMFGPPPAGGDRVLKTPLPQKTLDLLADEISGQLAFNNEVLLAGTTYVRDENELTDMFYETRKLLEIARKAGLDKVKAFRYPQERKFDYAREGELRLVKPEERLIARLDTDAALVAGGSASVDATGELIYLPPFKGDQVNAWLKAGLQDRYRGKIALMWSHPRRDVALALDAAGIAGVISFESQDRYFDPDEVIFADGPYDQTKNMRFGLTLSWRQWSELLEDVETGKALTVRCRTTVQSYPDRVEGVTAWIQGTEPQQKGIILTGHLFEGYTKRGANDDISGCVAEFEVFRALTSLIKQGLLPPPRRTITFLWTNEIGGTFEYIKQNPGLAAGLSADINMDMVGEGLRKNNGVFILTESTNALPSYMDGLGRSILNYIWRTNDIVYLPDSPQGPRSEQVFPRPIWERNGSRDAFRFDVQMPTGGSDHICFISPTVAVPAVSLNVWPDQWYHSDLDLPDKSDPTELRRAAFLGAAMAWAAANCTEDVLEGLTEAVEEFGYDRIARRELPAALRMIEESGAMTLGRAWNRAEKLAALGVERERGALESIRDISPDSDKARRLIADRAARWAFYGRELLGLIENSVQLCARRLKTPVPVRPRLTAAERRLEAIVPSFTDEVKGKEFRLESSPACRDYLKAHPDALKGLNLNYAQRRALLSFTNGRRSLAVIRDRAEAETGGEIPPDTVVRYFDFLKAVRWVAY
jgi:aminopeptidase YwaD